MASALSLALQGCYVSLVGPSDFGKSPSAVLQTVLKSWAGLSTCPADVDLDVSDVREAVFRLDRAHFAPGVPCSHGIPCKILCPSQALSCWYGEETGDSLCSPVAPAAQPEAPSRLRAAAGKAPTRKQVAASGAPLVLVVEGVEMVELGPLRDLVLILSEV